MSLVKGAVKESLGAFYSELDDDTQKINQYIIKDVLGRGAYGVVSRAIDQNTGEEYAVKEFSKVRLRRKEATSHNPNTAAGRGRGRGRGRGNLPIPKGLSSASSPGSSSDGDAENPLYLIRGELAVYKKLAHPNVVKLFEVLDDPNQGSIFMVFEMCARGVVMDVSLDKDGTPMDLDEARRIFQGLVLGIEYLHESGVAHRDIKPDNLMLALDGTVKIVDFGVSSFFQGSDNVKANAGTPAFMSPELTRNEDSVSGRASDIWAMGVTLYCLVMGRLPFKGASIIDVFQSIQNDEPFYPDDLDADLKDLLQRMMEKDPQERITMTDIRTHPWVTKQGSAPLTSFEENTRRAVLEITEDEINNAFKGIQNVFTVLKAVSKLKGLRNRKNSASAAPSAEQPSSTVTAEEAPAPIQVISEEQK